jgi:hypothetical protein
MKSLASLILLMAFLGWIYAAPAFAQGTATPNPATSTIQTPTEPPAGDVDAEPPGGKRVFGVLPNYRTADASQIGTVITARQKLTIARKDSFDYPLILLGGFYAGLGQASNADPSFGQGLKGFAHRLATNYTDQAVGNMFSEGIYPALLHEDPRYFQLGSGTVWHRTSYALTRILVTNKDGGGKTFNFSEWLGNGTAVAISNAYYPDDRHLTDNATKLLEEVGTDAISQVLKEFWPDIKAKLFHKQAAP